MPRREKTNPILAVAQATLILAGSVMVMPTPTDEPLMATSVGFEQLCIARATLPPLLGYPMSLLNCNRKARQRTHPYALHLALTFFGPRTPRPSPRLRRTSFQLP